jgi:tetratricopeptide (TPR) repeat protein
VKILLIFALTIICFSSLTACSSNQRKGDNMMETEQYEQAVFFYEKAFINNPDNEDIAQKLSMARSRLVAGNLIEVRMFRQSNLPVKAAKKLNQSLQQMEMWNVFADSAVKATINEEVTRAAAWLNTELETLAEQEKHNRFIYSLKLYDHIIDSGLNTHIINEHKPQMIKLGQLQCQAMRKKLNQHSYFYHDIWQSYCANFGGAKYYQLSDDPSRFSGPSITTSKLYISSELDISKKAFGQTLNQQLSESLWFSEHSRKTLPIKLSGRISYKKKTKIHVFSFIHTNKKEIFEIIRDEKNPKITKRKLVKVIPYEKTLKVKGQVFTESVSHNLSLTSILHKKPIKASEVSAKRDYQAYAHQAYFKKKNIRPLKPTFFNTAKWFSNIGSEATGKVISDLDNAWITYFCSQEPVFGLPKYENSARCAQLVPDHPVVTNWVKNEFDLNYDELEVLLD